LVCFTLNEFAEFKLGILEGIYYHVWVPSGSFVDGLAKIYECNARFCVAGTITDSNPPQVVINEFIWGVNYHHHLSTYFDNKVMGPEIRSDQHGIENYVDNFIWDSSFGEYVLFLFKINYCLTNFLTFYPPFQRPK